MIEFKDASPNLIPEQYQKLQAACQHDQQVEGILDYLNDPDEIKEVYQDLKGTRKIIFSLLLDLELVGPGSTFAADQLQHSLNRSALLQP